MAENSAFSRSPKGTTPVEQGRPSIIAGARLTSTRYRACRQDGPHTPSSFP